MEMYGRFSRDGEKWVYACALFRGEGDTPEAAYAAYLKVFDSRGPTLPQFDKKKGG